MRVPEWIASNELLRHVGSYLLSGWEGLILGLEILASDGRSNSIGSK